MLGCFRQLALERSGASVATSVPAALSCDSKHLELSGLSVKSLSGKFVIQIGCSIIVVTMLLLFGSIPFRSDKRCGTVV